MRGGNSGEVDRWLRGGLAGACLLAASGMPAARPAALVQSEGIAGWPLVDK